MWTWGKFTLTATAVSTLKSLGSEPAELRYEGEGTRYEGGGTRKKGRGTSKLLGSEPAVLRNDKIRDMKILISVFAPVSIAVI
jgi:hypothetical protein